MGEAEGGRGEGGCLRPDTDWKQLCLGRVHLPFLSAKAPLAAGCSPPLTERSLPVRRDRRGPNGTSGTSFRRRRGFLSEEQGLTRVDKHKNGILFHGHYLHSSHIASFLFCVIILFIRILSVRYLNGTDRNQWHDNNLKKTHILPQMILCHSLIEGGKRVNGPFTCCPGCCLVQGANSVQVE